MSDDTYVGLVLSDNPSIDLVRARKAELELKIKCLIAAFEQRNEVGVINFDLVQEQTVGRGRRTVGVRIDIGL